MSGDETAERAKARSTADMGATAVIVVWGVAYLLAAALAPGLVGNLPTVASAGAMVLVGVSLLWSVVRESWLLYAALALVETGSMVGSWTGVIRWTVPYDPGIAAVSMAAADFVVAVVLVYKAIRLAENGVDLPATE